MSNDGVAPVNHSGVITSFIEHTHIEAKHVCHIDSTAHTAFIRANHHHVIGIELQILYIFQKTFDKLIGGLYRFKAM